MKHLECNTDLDYQISIGDMETLDMVKSLEFKLILYIEVILRI